MRYRALLLAMVLNACASPDALEETRQATHLGITQVVLTFDDTHADNAQVAAMAEARGMRAVFYVNSSRVGQPGWMTLEQLRAMEAAGHEIAGHTITHARLASIEVDEARREVCNDRVALMNMGFRITSFAYPFSSQNETVQQIAEDCGYNSARLVGGLVMPSSCSGCPYANPLPPPDPYALRTNASVKEDTTLDDLKGYVTRAEQNGGGMVPIVFHHVCDSCDSLRVSPATLAAFMDWLAPRTSIGTRVYTMDEVIGGDEKPPVAGPPVTPPATGNLLRNPSLETDSNGDQVPDCWQRGTYGTSTASYTLTSNAYEGSRAQRIDISSYSSGARRLVSAQDTGTCAPAVTPGRRYTMTARYITNGNAIVSVYVRNASGSWSWFAQSAPLPVSSSYALATYTTPALPTGATHLSVGISLQSAGSLTTDAYTLVDASAPSDTTPPTVAITSPAAGATVSGTVSVTASASDNTGIARVELLANGTLVGTDTASPYAFSWNTGAYAGQAVTLTARAVDTSNNIASATRTVNVAPAADTTPPTVALTSPANGATVSGTVTLSADAADASGIARVEFFANGALIATEANAPYLLDWDTTPFAGQTVTLTARAFDPANNSTTSAPRTVTVAGTPPQDTTPPTVALTSPANNATVNGTVTLAADAADASGIARVELFANGTLIGTETTAPYELPWDTTPYAGQTVTLTAIAYDTANNSATSAARTVTVSSLPPQDTTPPAVALTSPAAGATVSGTVTLGADASDASGIARVEFLVDGAVVGTDTTSPYSVAWNSSGAAGTTVTLAARAVDTANNTATSPTRQVTVAPSAPANLLQNASLETDANSDQVPDCWQRGGSGTNAATYTLTTNAFDGTRAQRIDMTSYTSGARRIVSLQDSGACAPAATPGRRYTVTARYIANAPAVFSVYYRSSSGAWVWWAQSPALPSSSSYALGTYTTPAVPAGATHISVGLSIINVGSLTMDSFTLVEAP